MRKYIFHSIYIACFLLSGCQSMEQLSIDYLVPADVNFPQELRRVAVVNNMPQRPDSTKIVHTQKEAAEEFDEILYTASYYGNSTLATEALAESLADQNYFDEVVICDSALRANDVLPQAKILSETHINHLTQSLDVDFIISLEDVRLDTERKVAYMPEWGVFYGTVDVKAYPTIKIYLPSRTVPMVTVNGCDSIFWEKAGNTKNYVSSHLIPEKEMINQASQFAGTIPIKHLLPYWKTARRYYFTGGSVNMRDAAIYAREKNWSEAIALWKQQYNTRKNKQKMYAAYNLALGYEMQDDIATACEWAQKAQEAACIVDGIDPNQPTRVNALDVPNYVMTTLYLNELREREEGRARLNAQMQRFNNDF